MSDQPLSENSEPAPHPAGTMPAPQPSTQRNLAPEINLEAPTPDPAPAPADTIIKEPLFQPILQGDPHPDNYPSTGKMAAQDHPTPNPPYEPTPPPEPQDHAAYTHPAPLPIPPDQLQPAPSPPIPKPQKADRIHSIDALRGFDMFLIVGGGTLLLHLAKLYDWTWLKWTATQLHHTEWAGFTFYDLIFPLFLFLAGVSMPISLGQKIDNGATKTTLLRKITLRAIILILLGIIYNGGLELKPLAETRLFSVLGFIGISYLIAGLIYIYSDVKHRIIWAIGLLAGYYAALTFIHVPGHGPGVLTPEGIFTGHIDRTWTNWKLLTPNYDPEGLFLPISGSVVAIVGSLTGSFLVRSTWNKFLKAILLGATGAALYYAAQHLQPHMIISKAFWSPTFVILCLGWSLMLLGAFYLIMDAIGFWHWAFFFTVIGMNSITIYMGLKLFNIQETSNKLFAGIIDHYYKVEYQPLITTIAFILTWWTILLVMYRKKVFLKV